MSARITCWWCEAEAVDVEAVVVAEAHEPARLLVVEWPDHPRDHEHTARPPSPEELTEAAMQRFLRAIGMT